MNHHHRVSEQGKLLGISTAHMAEVGVPILAAAGFPDERCKSCAFRTGTVPNGCLQTQMDVLKAVAEIKPFACHVEPKRGELCHGWLAARAALAGRPAVACEWEFSPADATEGAPA